MCTPPVGEPEPRAVPPNPPASEGQFWQTLEDAYEYVTNRFEVFQGSRYERTLGVQVRMGMNTRTELVYGWSHSTVLGFSLAHIMGFDNKLNALFVANFIRPEKTETTKGKKTEVLLAGLKLSHVTGKKNKFVGSNKVKSNDLAVKQLEVKVNEHWATLEKMLTDEYKQTVADLREEHDKLSSEIRDMDHECKLSKSKGDRYVEKTNTWIGDVRKFREESDTVDMEVKGKWKIVSDAAAEFSTDGVMECGAGNAANFTADSLISFAASIIQLG